VRLLPVSVSVSLPVLRLSLSLSDSDQAIVTHFETQKAWASDDDLILLIEWYYNIRFFGHELEMSCSIIMPRSHGRGQEGFTRCASTCGRYSNGSRYWYCWCHSWALEFCSGSSRFLQQVQVQSWCWLIAELERVALLESSALAASLVSLIVHPVVHVCIHHKPAQRAELAKNKICFTYTTCLAHILKHTPVEC